MSEVLDVAVIGAGIAGVYAAWRLRTDQAPGAPQPNVQVFESSERIGGRLLSVNPPGMDDVFCELGGMRYTSAQPLVSSLIEHKLMLPTQPFSVGEPENLNYMRGERFRNRELAAGCKIPYRLTWSEQGTPIDELLGGVLDQLIPGVTQMSGDALHAFLRGWMVDGHHLYNWGFWNLLARGMSHEAYELARVTCGYDTVGLNWNAMDTIGLNFDLAEGVTFSHVTNGYQQVPLRVAQLFEDAGGTIHRGRRMAGFDRAADGTLTLDITDPDGANPQTISAKALVLALPRRSLELLDARGPVLAPDVPGVRALIESVQPIPLFKMFVAYPYPWWETVGVSKGRSVTDLPVRQCYYWATGHVQHDDPADRPSVLLATYDDTLNVDFWTGYTTGHHVAPGRQDWEGHDAPPAMVREIDRQLRELHDVRFAPAPTSAAYMDWGVDPYGGGVNFWKVGAHSWDVIPKITQPVGDVPVYICGEAYSNAQGWVEGSLQTTEYVLQNHFGLAAPKWVVE